MNGVLRGPLEIPRTEIHVQVYRLCTFYLDCYAECAHALHACQRLPMAAAQAHNVRAKNAEGHSQYESICITKPRTLHPQNQAVNKAVHPARETIFYVYLVGDLGGTHQEIVSSRGWRLRLPS